jgi:hypothetical protein
MRELFIVGTFERWNVGTFEGLWSKEGVELAVEELALLGSGVGVGLAERAVFADEEEVDLGEGAVERAVENGNHVVDDEAEALHIEDKVVELGAADHGGEEGAFEHDDFGVLEGAGSAGEDLELGALNVKLDEIGAGKIFFGALLVEGDDGDGAGSAVDGGAFDFVEEAGADFVGMDVESGGAGRLAGGSEDVLGVVGGADFLEERLELGERLDEEDGGGGESLVELESLRGDAGVNDGGGLETEARELAESAGHAGAGRRFGGGGFLADVQTESVEEALGEMVEGGHEDRLDV